MARILVIDDEAVIREPITASLRAAGHDAAGFGDGTSALIDVRRQTPELILLDVKMSGRDGLSVLREIRRMPEGETIPVLLLTNSTEKATILQAARLGVEGYLLKSTFSLEELLKRIGLLVMQANAPSEAAVPAAPAAADAAASAPAVATEEAEKKTA